MCVHLAPTHLGRQVPGQEPPPFFLTFARRWVAVHDQPDHVLDVLPGNHFTHACTACTAQVVCEPYLQSEYGSDYTTDSPVKLLDRLYYGMPK